MNEPTFFDVETTGATNGTKGNPFSRHNRLVLGGFHYLDGTFHSFTETQTVEAFRNKRSSFLVGVNIKFDLHWLSRYMDVADIFPISIWDCQYAQYCIWRQQVPWISLDDCLTAYGFPLKLDVVKTEYWDKGIDTDQVPFDILWDYLKGDLERTKWVYQSQLNYLADKPDLYKLILMGMEDILTTFLMENNGIRYDYEGSIQGGTEKLKRIEEIDQHLNALVCSPTTINWASNAHISAVLFGGVVKEKYRERYQLELKSGQIKEKERWSIREVPFPALMKPLKGTETKHKGVYQVGEDVLIKLSTKGTKKTKKIIDLLLERTKLETAVSRYYFGLPQLMDQMNWGQKYLYGNLNHAITKTGRIASNKPNRQNFPEDIGQYCVSRFSG